jgi:hypothetical protein
MPFAPNFEDIFFQKRVELLRQEVPKDFFLRKTLFDPAGHMILSEHMKSCLAALIRFMLFKGPGSLKNFFKSAEM